jgi:hypothetical protein
LIIHPGAKTFAINPDPFAIIPLVWDTNLQPVAQRAFSDIQLFAYFARGIQCFLILKTSAARGEFNFESEPT